VLIFQMVADNPTWGAPRIHGELQMLGFVISERTVSRWVQRALRNPESAKRWLTFLRNHREIIAAMDLFTVPTLTFGSCTASSLHSEVLGRTAWPSAGLEAVGGICWITSSCGTSGI
jgi:hypothetical protein